MTRTAPTGGNLWSPPRDSSRSQLPGSTLHPWSLSHCSATSPCHLLLYQQGLRLWLTWTRMLLLSPTLTHTHTHTHARTHVPNAGNPPQSQAKSL